MINGGDYAQSKARFESDPHVRVLMENGAGSPVGTSLPFLFRAVWLNDPATSTWAQ